MAAFNDGVPVAPLFPEPVQPRRGRCAFIWPKDGKRTSTAGRWADILTGRGPDIHVAKHRGYLDGHNLGWDAPRRSQWSRWANLDPFLMRNATREPMPWARRGDTTKYDFRTRRWGRCHDGMWSDVVWPAGARTRDQTPVAFNAVDGLSWQPAMHPWNGYDIMPFPGNPFPHHFF